ncbi:hypothetical protein KC345_g6886 [Hortaea werneckii]|nr:hypothetical protein KC345_g6886 [Hortaea werneckii]
MADFNSDDIEFSPEQPQQPKKKYGSRSIEKMLESAETDRIESKRIVQQLKFGQGRAPATQAQQSLWIERFQAFREGVLKQGDAARGRPFTSDDLIRFLTTILDKMELERDKPAPNLYTITSAIKCLLAYGTFTWREFSWSKYDSARIGAWAGTAVQEGRLIRGIWKKRVFIGFPVLSRLVREFLQHARVNGCMNFDIVVAKMLSVVLTSSLGARAGDVALSDGYEESSMYCLQFRHIQLRVRGEEGPRFENLYATVELEFTKGKKTERNVSEWRSLRPLQGAHNYHVCPISLLLTHCLRHGLVPGTTVDEVLQNAWRRSDRTVMWEFPTRPVLPRIDLRRRCELDRPARTQQVRNTLAEMGIVSGIAGRLPSHGLRLGHANDVAKLPARVTDDGMTSLDLVRQSLGHSYAAQLKGVTEGYTDGLSVDFYNLRATHPAPSNTRGAPSFVADKGAKLKRKQAPISEEEIAQRGHSKMKLKHAQRAVRNDRMHDDAQSPILALENEETARAILAEPSPLPNLPFKPAAAAAPAIAPRLPLAPRDGNIPSVSMRATSDIQAIDPAILSPEELEEAATNLAYNETVTQLEALL